MKRNFLSLILAAVLGVFAADASAAVIAKDSYDGYTAGNLTGQSSSTAVGFAGAWGPGSANVQVEAGGILDGDASSGQGRFIPVGQAFGAYRGKSYDLAPIATDPPNNTFYTSQLVFAGNSGGLPGEFAMVGFGSFVDQGRLEGNTDFLLGAYTGFVTQADGTADLVIKSRTGAFAPGAVTDTTLLEDVAGQTFQVVMALEYNNPSDEIRYWVNPARFSEGEAGMTATALATGTIPGFQLGGLGDMNRFSVGTTFTNRSFFWDEVILASSAEALIPEPTSALLALVGCGVFAARRR